MGIKKIKIYKASQSTKGMDIPSIEISIIANFPDSNLLASFEETFAIYQKDAELIANALFESLPQGTLDRLITEMMGRKAKHMGYKGVIE